MLTNQRSAAWGLQVIGPHPMMESQHWIYLPSANLVTGWPIQSLGKSYNQTMGCCHFKITGGYKTDTAISAEKTLKLMAGLVSLGAPNRRATGESPDKTSPTMRLAKKTGTNKTRFLWSPCWATILDLWWDSQTKMQKNKTWLLQSVRRRSKISSPWVG